MYHFFELCVILLIMVSPLFAGNTNPSNNISVENFDVASLFYYLIDCILNFDYATLLLRIFWYGSIMVALSFIAFNIICFIDDWTHCIYKCRIFTIQSLDRFNAFRENFFGWEIGNDNIVENV